MQQDLHDSSSRSSGHEQSVAIWHRVIPYSSPSSDSVRWSKRGTVQLSQGHGPTWLAAEDDAFATLADDGDLYQIGFEGKTTALEASPSVHSFVSIPEVCRQSYRCSRCSCLSLAKIKVPTECYGEC